MTILQRGVQIEYLGVDSIGQLTMSCRVKCRHELLSLAQDIFSWQLQHNTGDFFQMVRNGQVLFTITPALLLHLNCPGKAIAS